MACSTQRSDMLLDNFAEQLCTVTISGPGHVKEQGVPVQVVMIPSVGGGMDHSSS